MLHHNRRAIVLILLVAVYATVTHAQDDTLDWIVDLIPDASTSGVVDKVLVHGDVPLTSGDLLLEESFDTQDAWEIYEASDGRLNIDDGHYRIRQRAVEEVLWGQNGLLHENVIIEVETEQMSPANENGYGLMCRANPVNNSDGYYFNISGDGTYNIRLRQNRQVSDLLEPTSSEAINQGQAINRIMAVCYENSLALYINDIFVAEVIDDTYQQGVTGLSAFTSNRNAPVDITFDNLRIWSVTEAEGLEALAESPTPESTESSPMDDIRSMIEASPEQQALITQLEQATTPISLGGLLRDESFDSPEAWPPAGNNTIELRVTDSAYRMTNTEGGGQWAWSIGSQNYETGVVVQVHTDHLSDELNNGYGIICRGVSLMNSTGYYLNISGDGFTSLFASNNGQFSILRDWTFSEAINIGGENTLTAVCVDDYLALYANGTLLYEVRDDLFDSGRVGFALVGYDQSMVVDLAYDDLRIWEASLGE